MNNDLVIFGEDWGGHPSSTQHIARRLAQRDNVVWVNSLGMRRPRLTANDLSRTFRKASRMVAQSAAHTKSNANMRPERMSVVDPHAISWPGNPIAGLINRHAVGRQVRASLAQRGMSKPILWTSLPSALPLIGVCSERAVVYYCGDDFGALAGVDHHAVMEMERILVEKADLVFAASVQLAERFPVRKTVLLQHGVDFELFATPVARAPDLPVGKRVAGFYGSIAEWIDIEMVAHAARRLPDWNFVLIGQVQTDVSVLRCLPNIHLLGARAHESLPAYAQHWDVSLLPFRDTQQIRACNPLKLREYLAAGRPVVSTRFPALGPYLDQVTLVDDAGDLARAITAAVEGKQSAEARRLRVADESWDARAEMVSRYLAAL